MSASRVGPGEFQRLAGGRLDVGRPGLAGPSSVASELFRLTRSAHVGVVAVGYRHAR